MKKLFLTDCDAVRNTFIEYEKDGSLPLLNHIYMELHLWFCPACSEELRNLRCVEEIMKTAFFPPSPGFEEAIMQRLPEEDPEVDTLGRMDVPAGFSFRCWILTGFFVLISLSTVFFGVNFIEIADMEGLSFLLPVGLTIGVVLSCYGAMFIGSHLEDLSSRVKSFLLKLH